MAIIGYRGYLAIGDPPSGSGETAADIDVSELDEVACVKNITINRTSDEAEKSLRKDKGNKTYAAGARTLSIEVEIEVDPSDDQYLDIEAAYMTRSKLAVAVLDSDPNDIPDVAIGDVGIFVITNFSTPQNYGEVQVVSITLSLYQYGYRYPVEDDNEEE